MGTFQRAQLYLILAIVGSAALVFLFDVSMELGVASAVTYVVVVWIAFLGRSRTWISVTAAVCVLLTILGYLLSPSGGENWKVLVNRALAVFSIGFTAYLCDRVKVVQQLLRRNEQNLEQRVQEKTREHKRAQAMFRATFESAPTAMVLADAKGRIVLVNAETEKLFGYSRDELLGELNELLAPEHVRGNQAWSSNDLNNTVPDQHNGADCDRVGLHKDGTEIPVNLKLKTVKTDQGKFVLSAIIDISQRKRSEMMILEANATLEKSNAELEQFAYVASHDLQEPLRKISSYAQLLKEECGPELSQDGLDYLSTMIKGAQRLKRLIGDLLSFSRITSRGNPLAVVDAGVCMQTAIDSLELAIRDNDAQVTFDALPKVMADESQLELLFQNLVGNALKYRGEASPVIHIGGRDLGDQFEFVVEDNGIGIEPQFYERIFQIFQRLHNRREYSGTGIGLSLCKRIVERFGGKIWLESSPGAGSSFYFTIQKSTLPEKKDVRIRRPEHVGSTH